MFIPHTHQSSPKKDCETETYRSHEQSKHRTQASTHNSRHERLAHARLHAHLHLCHCVSHYSSPELLLSSPSQDQHTAFTICCSCSDMPALGFMAAGIAPAPPGNAIVRERKWAYMRKGKCATRGDFACEILVVLVCDNDAPACRLCLLETLRSLARRTEEAGGGTGVGLGVGGTLNFKL